MVTSSQRGHKIYHKDGQWLYLDNNSPVEIPDSWRDRCSGNGYERYTDNDMKVSESPWRPCARCGQYPTQDGDDCCLQHLGNVMNACCGHGNGKGYIQFDNGVTIRGYFEIEYSEITTKGR